MEDGFVDFAQCWLSCLNKKLGSWFCKMPSLPCHLIFQCSFSTGYWDYRKKNGLSNLMKYLFILIAYLSGSVPYGLILTKIFGGVDVRKIGSGNIGTTN